VTGLTDDLIAQELDREQPIVSICMLDRLVSRSTGWQQSLGLLFGIFAAVAVGLRRSACTE
jgi:hypothetical protein